MPGGDRTGPWGFGPMTGRGLGWCAGGALPFGGRWWTGGVGYGWGRGRCMGMRRRIGGGRWAFGTAVMPHVASSEKAWLENRLSVLSEEVRAVQERLRELQEGTKET